MALIISLFLLLFSVQAHASIPDSAKTDSRFLLGLLVCNKYPGVNKDFSGDSTNGLNTCIEDAHENQLATYLECGTYAVTNTVKLYEWVNWKKGGPLPQDPHNHVFRGESDCPQGWPELKLKTSAVTGFTNKSSPRPVMAWRAFQAANQNAKANAEPLDPLGLPANFNDFGKSNFGEILEGIRINTNGNAGAIGLAFSAAQDSAMRDVQIEATGSLACFYGLPGRTGPAAKLKCVGGDYGIRIGSSIPFTPNGTMAAGVELLDQKISAAEGTDASPIVLVGFKITAATPAPAIEAKTGMVLYDGTIEMRGAAQGMIAIDNPNGRDLYIHNVFVTGTTKLFRNKGGATMACGGPVICGEGTWSRIAEFAYNDQTQADASNKASVFPTYVKNTDKLESRSVVDGVLRSAPIVAQDIMANAGPPVGDLLSRHVPGHFPSFEDGPFVQLKEHGGPTTGYLGTDPEVGNTGPDSTKPLQDAILAAAAAGHGRVWLPRGTIYTSNLIRLKKNTVLMGPGLHKSIIASHKSWQPPSPVPMLLTDNDPTATTTATDFTLFLRNAPIANDWMYYLRWRAGRKSLTFGLSLDAPFLANCFASGAPVNQKRYAVWFNGGGGGKHYGLQVVAQKMVDRNNDSRQVYVNGTTEPLSFYGLNTEFGKMCVIPHAGNEITGAKNVRIFGMKREGRSPTLLIHDSQNIGLFGVGKMAEVPGNTPPGILQITGESDNIVVGIGGSVSGSGLHKTNNEPQVYEALTPSSSEKGAARAATPIVSTIPWPTRLSYLRRGKGLDDSMFGFVPSATSPPVAPPKKNDEGSREEE